MIRLLSFFSIRVSFLFSTRVALAVVCWVGHDDAMIRGMVLCL